MAYPSDLWRLPSETSLGLSRSAGRDVVWPDKAYARARALLACDKWNYHTQSLRGGRGGLIVPASQGIGPGQDA